MSDRRKFYEQQLEQKRKDLASVTQDLAGDNTQEEERRLNNRAEQILDEIESLENKLDPNHQDNKLINLNNNHWEQHLHKIDYKKAEGIIKSTLEKIDRDPRATLFLFEKSSEFCGKYCIQHLRDQLERQGILDYPYTVDFQPGQKLAPDVFLHTLAQKLQVNLSKSEEMTLTAVLDGLCHTLKGRSILFFHINLELADVDSTFLEWVVQDFWCRLHDRMPQLSKENPYLKLVGAISIDDTLPKPLLASLCCQRSEIHPTKLLKLPQEKWSKERIDRWIYDFSRLNLEVHNPTSIAQTIFKQTKGIPDRTERKILESLEKLAN